MGCATSGGNLGKFLGGQPRLGTGSALVPWTSIRPATTGGARAAVAVESAGAARARAAVTRGARAAVGRGGAVPVRSSFAGRSPIRRRGAIVAPGRTRGAVSIPVVAEVTIAPGSVLAVVDGRGQRSLSGGFSLGSGAAQRGPGSGQDTRGLSAHPEHAAAARGQDLEIELVEADTKLVSGSSKSFLHRLARELTVGVAKGSHVSVVSLYGWCACACWAGLSRPRPPTAPRAEAG